MNRISLEQAIENIIDAIKNKKPYSVIRIGDGEIDVINGKVGVDYGHAADHQNIGEYMINTEYDNIDDYYKNNKCPQCLK